LLSKSSIERDVQELKIDYAAKANILYVGKVVASKQKYFCVTGTPLSQWIKLLIPTRAIEFIKFKKNRTIFRGKPIGIYVFLFSPQLFGIFKEIYVLIESIYTQNYFLKKPLLKIKNNK
jgi:hypothetical protein